MSAYQSFLTALGWSLLDTIWQMGVLWLIYYFFTIGNSRISSAGKHNLILVFVFIGAEWFIYTLIHLMNEPSKTLTPGFIYVSVTVNSWIYSLSLGYLGVLIFRVLQYLVRPVGHRLERIEKIFSIEWQSFTDRNSRILGISRKVQVYVSDLAETAQTCGFLKPLILLPVSLVSSLSPKQIEAILIHELFHIRRNDYLINICMSCFRSIFFFNPFALLFYKTLERERELACDDGVIEMGYAPDQYAEALFRLEKFRQVQPGFKLAADGNKPWLLMERICRLLGKPTNKKSRFNLLVVLSLAASVLLFGLKINNTAPGNTTTRRTDTRTSNKLERFVIRQVNINAIEKAKTYKVLKHFKAEKSKKPVLSETSNTSEPLALISPEPSVKTYFTNENEVKNFSNQQADVLNQAIIINSHKIPYLPSKALSYQSVPEIIWQDSINNAVMQDNFKDLETLDQIKAIANLDELQSEIEKNSEQLHDVELKNKNLIQLDRKIVKPLLDNIHRQMKLKKEKINQLKIRLQVSEQEIIHI
jgi:beta-lactamase regulating signal transducer with metallopeptidase domain